MAFIQTVPDSEASGPLRDIYDELEDSLREALVVGRPFGSSKEATTA
jgi:hypothetical protein